MNSHFGDIKKDLEVIKISLEKIHYNLGDSLQSNIANKVSVNSTKLRILPYLNLKVIFIVETI